jgi:hypothetical protein
MSKAREEAERIVNANYGTEMLPELVPVCMRRGLASTITAALSALDAEIERLSAERLALLSVKTTEGLTASEWILRTGLAERERDALKQQNAELLEALKESRQALNYWTLTYAPDQCNSEAVDKCREDIYSQGGTLAYIAKIGAKCEAAIRRAEDGK